MYLDVEPHGKERLNTSRNASITERIKQNRGDSQFVTSRIKAPFLKENVSVNPSSGTVLFYGMYGGSKWLFTLQRAAESSQKAKITAALSEANQSSGTTNTDFDQMAKALALTTSQFFNEMVFELDGTFLSFEDMMLTDKGKEPSAMLSLKITVKKFPSPGLEF